MRTLSDEDNVPAKRKKKESASDAEERAGKRAKFTPLVLHLRQRWAAADKSRTVVVCAGRRGGKSHVAVYKGLETCLANDDVVVLYISATHSSAKKMAWNPAIKMNRDYALGGDPNRTDLILTFPNGSQFQVLGVDSEAAADKTRGIPKVRLAIVDEAQRYRPEILAYLIRDCLRPGLLDSGKDGSLWIMGTPSPLGQTGEFWDRWNKPENPFVNPVDSFYDPDGAEAQTATPCGFHQFTYKDNTFLGDPAAVEAAIEADLKDEGKTKESAWYLREYLCQWVVELSERAYQFDGERNIYHHLPADIDTFLICGDTGVKDADALGLLGWHSKKPPVVYLVKEHIRRGQDVDDLAEVLWRWWVEHKPCRIVLDAGANAKALLTLQNRYRKLPIFAADKPPVNLQVAELNLFLQGAILKVRADSRFAREVRLPTWKNGIVNGKILETGAKKSDIVPAIRYGCLAVRPYLPDIPEPKPQPGTEAAFDSTMGNQYIQVNPWQSPEEGVYDPGDGYNPFQQN